MKKLSIMLVSLSLTVVFVFLLLAVFIKDYTLDLSQFEKEVIHNGEVIEESIIIQKKTLFGKKDIMVTPDMVTNVDTSTPGEKKLTITYGGETFEVVYHVKFKVEFKDGSELISSQTVFAASEIVVPELTNKPGYLFVGWDIDIPSVLTSNLVINAKYEALDTKLPNLGTYNATYEDTLSSITLPSNEYGKWEFIDPLTTTVGNVGSNKFRVKFVSNYDLGQEKIDEVTIRVSKKTLEFKDLVLSFVYDGDIKRPTFSFGEGYDHLISKVLYIGDTAINVGKYGFILELNDENYQASYQGSMEITSPQIVITVNSYTINYGDSLPIFEYSVTGLEDASLLNIKLIEPNVVNAGTYEINVTVITDLFQDITINKGTLTVNKINMYDFEGKDSDKLPVLSDAYYSDLISAVTFSENPNGYWKWNDESVVISTPKEFSAVAVFVPKSPNYLEQEYTFKLDVLAKVLTFNIIQNEFVYDGLEHSIIFELKDDRGNVIEGLTVEGLITATNANTYRNNLSIIDDTGRYAGDTGNDGANLIIHKATPVISWEKVYTAKYGQTVSEVLLDEHYYWNTEVINTGLSKIGLNTFAAKYDLKNSNYNVLYGEITINVEKLESDFEDGETSFTYTYNGSAFEIGNLVTPIPSNAKLQIKNYLVDPTDPTKLSLVDAVKDAGSYQVKVVALGSDFYEESTELTLYITIEQVDINLPETIKAIYEDKLADLEIPSNENGTWAWVDSSLSVGVVGERMFFATFTSNNPNYKSDTYELAVLVSPKELFFVYEEGFNVFEYSKGVAPLLEYTLVDADGNSYALETTEYSVSGNNVNYINARDEAYPITLRIESDNYYGELVTTLIINKKIITKPAPCDNEFIYNGKEQIYPVDYSEFYDVDNNKHTDADTYSVTISLNDKNYIWDDGSSDAIVYEFVIKQKEYDLSNVKWSYTDPLTYNGKAQKVILIGLPDGVTIESYKGNEYTDAGTYTASVDQIKYDKKNYLMPEFDSKSWVINQKEVTINWGYSSTYTYNGEVFKTPTASIIDVDNNQIFFDVINSEEEFKNAGEYIFSTSLPKEYKMNYVLSSSSKEVIEIEVLKATFDMSAVKLDYKQFTYDGTVKTVEITGLPENLKVKSYSNNSFTDAGSYEATVTFEYDNNNYNTPADVEALSWTISAAKVDVLWVVDTYTYTGSELDKPTATFIFNDEIYNLTITPNKEFKNAGDYTFTAIIGDTNFELSNSTKNVNVKLAENEITDLTILGWTYGDDAKVPSATSKFGELIVYTYSAEKEGEYTSKVPTDAGIYYVKASVAATDNYNYKEEITSFVIAKQVVNAPDRDTDTFTYNGEEQTYKVALNDLYTVTGNKETNASTYYVAIALKDKTNFKWNNNSSEDLEYEFKISSKFVNKPALYSSAVYNMAEQTCKLVSTTQYTVSGKATLTDVGSTTLQITLKNPEGYKNYVWFGGTTDVLEHTFEVTKGQAVISDLAIKEWTYGDKANAPFATNQFNAQITYTYSSNGKDFDATVPTNAGTYYVKATVDSTDNFDGASEITTLVIKKKGVTKPTEDSSEFEYNTKEHTYVLGNTIDSDLYDVTGTTQTNAGNHTVKIVLKDKNNFAWGTSQSSADINYTFTIKSKVIQLPGKDDGKFVYNTQEHVYYIEENDAYSVTGNKQTVAGKHTVYIELNNPSGVANYIWNDETTRVVEYDFHIEKATEEITWPTSNNLTWGSKLGEVSLGSNRFSWPVGTNLNEVLKTPGEYYFDIVYTPEDTANYNKQYGFVTVIVNKKAVTITTKSSTEHTYNPSNSGFEFIPSSDSTDEDADYDIIYYYTKPGTTEEVEVSNITNAGSYRVEVKYKETDYYKETVESIEVNVAPAEVKMTPEEQLSITAEVGDTFDQTLLPGHAYGSWRVEEITSTYSSRNANTYGVVEEAKEMLAIFTPNAAIEGSFNYKETRINVRVKVTKRLLTFDVEGTITHEYDGTVPTIAYELVDKHGVKFTDIKVTGQNIKKDAGKYPINLEIESDLYVGNVSVTLIITPHVVNIPEVDTTQKFTYNNGQTLTYIIPSDTTGKYYTIGNNTAIDAGTYYPEIVLNDKHNYVWNNGKTDNITYEMIVNKAKFDMSNVKWDNKTFKYSGETKTVKVTGLPKGLEVLSYKDNSFINVGEYEAFIDQIKYDTKNYEKPEFESLKWSITKAQAVITVDKTPINKVYGDTWSIPKATTNFGFVDCDKVISDMVNAGTYTITYTVKGTENYCGAEAQVEVTINKFVVTKPLVPEGTNSFEYSGNTITYNLVENAEHKNYYTITGNSGKNADDYTVNIALKDQNNYVWNDDTTADYTYDFSIYAKAVDRPVSTKEYTYNGSSQTFDIKSTAAYKVSNNTTQTDADTYYVTVTLNNPEGYTNYVWSTEKDGSNTDVISLAFNIAKAKVDLPTVSGTYTYNKAPQTVALNGYNEKLMTIKFGSNTATEAGNYTVKVELKYTNNYEWANSSNGEIAWSIAKAKAVITVDEAPINKVYGDTWSIPEANTNFGAVDCDKVISDMVNAGTYVITYTVAETNNYYGDTKTINVTIASKLVDRPEEITTDFTYNGNEQTYTIIENAGYKVFGNKQTNADTYNVTVTLNNPEGYTNYVWSTKVNNNNTDMMTFKFVINKKDVVVNWQENTNYVYNGGENELTYPKAYIVLANEKPYPLTTTTTKDFINAGEYTFTAFTLDESINKNYSISLITKQYTIAKATITDPLEIHKAYNGSSQTSGLVENEYYTVTETAQTNKGSYDVVLTLKNFDNYQWSSQSISATTTVKFIITGIVNTWTNTPSINSSYTYGDSIELSKGVSANGSVEDIVVTYKLANASDDTYTSEVPENVGRYMVKVYLAAGAGDSYSALTWTQEFEIVPQKITRPTADDTVFTYNGNEQTYEIEENEGYTVTGNVRKNAGEYIVTVTLNKPNGYANYVWSTEKDGSNTDIITFEFNIAKAKVDLPTVVLPEETLKYIYNGSLQTVVLDDFDKELMTIVSGNSATDAGNYTVKVELKDTNNYEWANSSNGEIAWSIEKATYDMSGVSFADKTVDYVPSGHKLEITGNLPEGVTVKYTENFLQNVGSLTVTATFTGNKNYNDIPSKEATLTVQSAKIARPTADTTAFEYTGSELTYKVLANEGYTVTGNVKTNAGEHIVKVTLNNPEGYANYVWATENNGSNTDVIKLAFNIAKAKVDLPTVSGTYTYNEKEQTLLLNGYDEKLMTIVSGNTATDAGNYTVKVKLNNTDNYMWSIETNGEIAWSIAKQVVTSPNKDSRTFTYNTLEQTYSIDENSLYTISGNKATHAGTYEVVVLLINTNNYMWSTTENSENLTYEFIINAKEVERPLLYSSAVYNNAEQTCGLTSTAEYIVSGTNKLTDVGSTSLTITLNNPEGHTNYVWATGENNTEVLTHVFEITIGQTVISNLDITDWTYGQKANVPTATNNFNANIIYTYSASIDGQYEETVPTDAGTYYVKATVVGTDNYYGATATKSFEIEKATYDMSGVSFTDKIVDYVPAGHKLEIAGNLPEGVTVKYTENFLQNVGSLKVIATFTGNKNYNDIPSKEATLIVQSAKIARPTADTTAFEYTGSELTYNVLINDAYEVAGNKQTLAGNYVVTITLNNPEGYANYVWATEKDGSITDVISLVFNIAKAKVDLPTVSGTYTYNKKEQTVLLNGYDEKLMTIVSGNTATDAGNYTVKVKLNNTDNYMWSTETNGEIAWSIAQAEEVITVNTNDIRITYGDTLIIPKATAKFGEVVVTKGEMVNVGEYTITYTVEGTKNYIGDEKTVNVYITPYIVAKPAAGNTTLTYNKDGVTYNVESSLEYTISNNTGTNVGEYTAIIKLANPNYAWVGDSNSDLEYKFTVVAQTVARPTCNTVYTYTGEEQKYGIVTTDAYIVTGNVGINADKYPVTVTLNNPEGYTNYVWATGSDKTEVLHYSFIINPADPKNVPWPEENTLQIPWGSSLSDIKLPNEYFSWDEDIKDLVINEPKEENFTVYYDLGDPNYNVLEKVVKVIVTKQTTTLSYENNRFDYNPNTNNTNIYYDLGIKLKSSSTDITNSSTLSIVITNASDNSEIEKIINAGTYNVVVNYTGDDKYYFAAETLEFMVTVDTILESIDPTLVFTAKYADDLNGLNTRPTSRNGTWELSFKDGKTMFDAVGEVEITATFTSTNSNYHSGSTPIVVNVSQATNTITSLLIDGWTYGEDANTPTSTNRFNGVVTYTYSTSQNSGYSSTVPTEAGTYYVKASVAATDVYSYAEATTRFVIEQKEVNLPTVSGTYTYNKASQTVVLNGYDSKYMTIESGNTATNAGNYTVVITLDNNHKWSNSTDGKVNWIIQKASFDMINVTITQSSFEYDGKEHEVTFENLPEGVKIDTLSGNIATNAGEYTLSATFDYDSENYEKPEISIKWNITKKNVTVNWQEVSYTYTPAGLTPPTATITLVDGNSLSLTVTCNKKVFKEVGTYKFTASTANENISNNYNISGTTKDYVVGQGTPITNFGINLGNAYYGALLNTVSLPASTDLGHYEWVDGSVQIIPVNDVYEFSANAKFIPNDTTNYKTVTGEFKITVIKNTGSLTLDESYTHSYNEVAYDLTNEVKSKLNYTSNDITFTYYLIAGETETKVNSILDAGAYKVVVNVAASASHTAAQATTYVTVTKGTLEGTVTAPTGISGVYNSTLTNDDLPQHELGTWTLVGGEVKLTTLPTHTVKLLFTPKDSNYNTIIFETVTVIVTKMEASVKVSIPSSLVYDGNKFSYTKWFSAVDSNGKSIDGLTISITITDENGGNPTSIVNAGKYKLTYQLEESTYYLGTEAATVPIEVQKADYTPISIPSGLTADYGQTLSAITIPNAADGKWSWVSGETLVGSVGNNTFKATFTPNNTTNYNSSTHDITITVNKVGNAITSFSATGWTYGSPKTPTAAAQQGTPMFMYSNTSDGEFTSTVPTNAGTYYVKAVVVETTDYDGCESKVIEIKIAKAKPQVTFPTYSGTYEGAITKTEGSHNVPGTFNAPTAAEVTFGSFQTLIAGNNTGYANAADGIESTITMTFTPTDTNNYESVTHTISITLKPVCYVGTAYYGTIENALNNNTSGTVFVIPGTNPTIRSDVTVQGTVTLFVPYMGGQSTRGVAGEAAKAELYWASDGSYQYDVNSTTPPSTATQYDDFATSFPTLLKNTVTLAEGIKLTISSGAILEISGQLCSGGGNSNAAGQTFGWYSQVVLKDDAIIENNGSIHCYGYIQEASKDNGSAIINNNYLYLPFVIRDFRGGSVMFGIYNSISTYEAASFNTFEFRNISTLTQHNYGSNVYGIANLWAGEQQNVTLIHLIGTSGAMIDLTQASYSYLTIKFDPETEKHDIDIYGGAKTNSLSLTLKVAISGINLGTKTISTEKVYFPITWKYDISLNKHKDQTENAVYDLKQKFKLMTGAKLTVEQGATLNITKLNVYTSFVDELSNNSDANYRMNYLYHNGTPNAVKFANSPATFIVNGIANVDYFGGIVYTEVAGAELNIEYDATLVTHEPKKVTGKSISASMNSSTPIKETTRMYLFKGTSVDSRLTEVGKGYYKSNGIVDKFGWYSTSATVYYEPNGGELGEGASEKRIDSIDFSGHTITKSDLPVNNPTREHYIFDEEYGWYIDSNCTIPALGQTIYTSVNLYAKWIPINYGIVYEDVFDETIDDTSGTTEINSKTSFHRDLYTTFKNELGKDPSHGNLVFGGFYLDKECTIKAEMIDGLLFTDGEYLSDVGVVDSNGNRYVKVYIKWHPAGTKSYKLTFENPKNMELFEGKIYQNATCVDASSFVVNTNSPWPTLETFQKANDDTSYPYYFINWTDENGNVVTSIEALFPEGVTERTIYANWGTKATVTIEERDYQGEIILDNSVECTSTFYWNPKVQYQMNFNDRTDDSVKYYLWSISNGKANGEKVEFVAGQEYTITATYRKIIQMQALLKHVIGVNYSGGLISITNTSSGGLFYSSGSVNTNNISIGEDSLKTFYVLEGTIVRLYSKVSQDQSKSAYIDFNSTGKSEGVKLVLTAKSSWVSTGFLSGYFAYSISGSTETLS